MADEQDQHTRRTDSHASERKGETPPEQSEAVKTDDDRYVGVDPIYAQSAYEEPLEAEVPKDADDKDAAKEVVERERMMVERVKRNEAGCVVNVDEPQPFEEWVATAQLGTKASVKGVDEKDLKAAQKATDDAKDETGSIPPSSGSTDQPGVNRV